MPRVPTLSRQVGPRALPDTRQSFVPSAASFGANLAGDVQQVALQLYERKQAASDDAALLEFDNGLAQWEHTRLHDPNAGVLNTVKGKDALDLSNTLGEEYDTVSSEAIGKLLPRQQAAAQRLALRRREGIISTLDTYGSREGDAYEQAQVESSLKTSVQLGIANATDPVRLKTELDRQQMIVGMAAEKRGLPPEVRDQQIADLRTATVGGAIDQLLAVGRDQAAQALFDATKDGLTGDKLAGIERALEEGNLRGEGQRQSDRIMATAKTLGDAREAVKAIDNPKLRDEVQQRVEHEWALNSRQQQDAEEQTLITAYNLVESGGLKAIPPATWTTLSGGARSSLRAYAKQLAEGSRPTVKTDYETLYALIRQSAEDPEAFAKQPLLSYKHKLSDGDFEQLAHAQAAVISGGKKGSAAQLDDYRTELQTVDQVLGQSGIDPNPPKTKGDDAAKVAWLRGQIASEVRRVQDVTKKKVTNDELEAITRRLLGVQVLDRGWFRNSTQPLMDATIDDVPTLALQAIRDEFRRAGVTRPTDQQVLQAWLDKAVEQAK